jgi:hypothetical protein
VERKNRLLSGFLLFPGNRPLPIKNFPEKRKHIHPGKAAAPVLERTDNRVIKTKTVFPSKIKGRKNILLL